MTGVPESQRPVRHVAHGVGSAAIQTVASPEWGGIATAQGASP
jgi:hypothetical protein